MHLFPPLISVFNPIYAQGVLCMLSHIVSTNIIAKGENVYWLLSCWRFYHQMFWCFGLYVMTNTLLSIWSDGEGRESGFISLKLYFCEHKHLRKTSSKNTCLKKTLVCLWKKKRCKIIILWGACGECRALKMCDNAAIARAVPEIWDYSVTVKQTQWG